MGKDTPIEPTRAMSAKQYDAFLAELLERERRLVDVRAHIAAYGKNADLAWMQRHLNPVSYQAGNAAGRD